MKENTKSKRFGTSGLLLFWIVPFLCAQPVNDGSRYCENSILASGKWIQLKVKENAIYKLTYDDIKKQGINDPSKVKIYGYGGWILDADFKQPYVDDLPEVAVYLNKGSDGVFNSGDYLLFYGRGTTQWTYNSSQGVYEHENNPYSTYGSYFMTEGDSGPKGMETVPLSGSLSGAVNLTVFDDYALHEKDSISITNSGRELFGESFVNKSSSQSFSFTVPGITSDPGKARLSFAAAPKVITPVKLSIGGQDILTMSINVPNDSYRKAYLADNWGNWSGEKTEKITASVTYNSSNQVIAYLNFIALNMKRTLQFYNTAYTFFRNKDSRPYPASYSIGNAATSCQVWDITQNLDARLMETKLEGGRLQFETPASGNVLREFVMVDLSKTFPTPEFAGEVKNQNLHALPATDMIILTPAVYLNQAEKLAEKHRTHSGLRVTVVDDRLVFNEFSSGTPDATAYRRFMKMFYDRATSDSDKPKYLLLFGDGLFDNRHLTPEGAKIDSKYYLLTYQVKESVDEIYSYGTDDYFGFLDDNEGISIHADRLDLGVGRFPVSSVSQAESAVNKVISYMENKQYGNWKTRLVFTADNTDTGSPSGFAIHAVQADQLAQYMDKNYPEYMVFKYYIDAYKLVSVNGKLSALDAKKALFNKLKEGCFLLNYTGHGSITDLSGEGLINIADVRQMNFENLPLWITATCDFGWFDGLKTSAGETAFLNQKSGAIALFTTSRIVSSYNNSLLNDQLIRYLFKKENGKNFRLGDVLRLSKIQLGSDSNKLNYVLLGDPALGLNYPEWNIQVESFNGNPISENDTLNFNTLDKVTLSGIITDTNGNKATDFAGTLNASVSDSWQTFESIVSDKEGNRFSFTDYPNMIYSGNSEVKNGDFSITFNVPLDISYQKTNGKINLYASNTQSKKDAFGNFQRYTLSGSKENPDYNSEVPVIAKMFLNTETFQNGDNVNETPFFYAEIADEYGINLSGGIGHGITICIDNKASWTYDLNNYCKTEDAKQGVIGFSIPELPPGRHNLRFKVWNILNLSTNDSLDFNVVKGYKPSILDLQARENPARTNTSFVLNHNLPETPLDVEIRVCDLTGRVVWNHSEKGSSGFLKYYPVEWNLTNSTGNRVHPGIYIYQAIVRTASSKEATQAKKIIVLGQ
jgi:hypothetical protein